MAIDSPGSADPSGTGAPTPEPTPPNPRTDLPVPSPPAPPSWDAQRKRDLVEALRRGSVDDTLSAFLGAGAAAYVEPAVRRMAEYIVEIRRQNVAVLGQADVFVRRSDAGELRQVVAPVTLSLDDGTLYQIPSRNEKRLRADPSQPWIYKFHKNEPYTWVAVYDEPWKALVSHEGLLRLNAVAGCSVVNTPTVNVDGRAVPNPYLERTEDGDVTRVVIGVAVAGPAPTTGNVVLVQYVLDLDPRADLLHMLSNIMKPAWKKDRKQEGRTEADDDADMEADAQKDDESVFLVSRAEFQEWRAELEPAHRRRWHWIKLHGGVGIAHDLRSAKVKAAYDKFIGISENLLKKALTVARRNAMKAHPALARHTVDLTKFDGTGNKSTGRGVTVPVVGWTSASPDMDRYARALDAVARGERAPGLDVISSAEVYDPARDRTGDAELDAVVSDDTSEEVARVDPRNQVLEDLDRIVTVNEVAASDLAAVGYPPSATATVQDLETMRVELLRRCGRRG